jgi:hypothetical protein
MSTFKELVDLFEVEYGEIVPKGMPQAYKKKLINLAQQDIAKRTRILDSQYTTNSVEDQATYGLTNEMAVSGIFRVFFDGTEIWPLSAPIVDTATGAPANYYLLERTIGLYPIPNADNASKEIRVYSYEVPSDMTTDAEVSPLPLEYHDLMVKYALARALAVARRFDEAAVYRAEYAEGIADIMDKSTMRQSHRLPHIVSLIRKL